MSESPASGIEVKNVDEGTSRAIGLRQNDAGLGRVIENRVLTAAGAPEKRHIGKRALLFYMLSCFLTLDTEFELPAGMTSRTGDYLAM